MNLCLYLYVTYNTSFKIVNYCFRPEIFEKEVLLNFISFPYKCKINRTTCTGNALSSWCAKCTAVKKTEKDLYHFVEFMDRSRAKLKTAISETV